MIEFTKENLEKLVKESKSKREVLIKSGRKDSYTQFDAKIKEYNIDISHFLSMVELQKLAIEKRGKEFAEKYTFEEVFCINPKCNLSGDLVKRKLFKLELKKKECELCGLGEEWNGSKLVHHLDHINGIRKDWRLENLRILCPNCHSITETYSGKNKKSYKGHPLNLDKKVKVVSLQG